MNNEWKKTDRPCPKCGLHCVSMRIVETDDGAHDDEQYRCMDCKYTWWVEGSDS